MAQRFQVLTRVTGMPWVVVRVGWRGFRRTLARVALAPALQSQPTTVLQSVFKNCNRERGTGSISTIEHDLEMDTPPQAQEKERKCLHCRDEFTSRWYGERVCRRCKSNSFWRGSVEAFLEL